MQKERKKRYTALTGVPKTQQGSSNDFRGENWGYIPPRLFVPSGVLQVETTPAGTVELGRLSRYQNTRSPHVIHVNCSVRLLFLKSLGLRLSGVCKVLSLHAVEEWRHDLPRGI